MGGVKEEEVVVVVLMVVSSIVILNVGVDDVVNISVWPLHRVQIPRPPCDELLLLFFYRRLHAQSFVRL